MSCVSRARLKKLFGFGVLALFSGAAYTADLPLAESEPAVAPGPAAYDWAGLYIGVNGGSTWVRGSIADIDCDSLGPVCAGAGGPFPQSIDLDDGRSGGIGGTIGLNRQANHIVFGIEGDLSWLELNQNGGVSFAGGGIFTPFTLSVQREVDWFGTLRGRLGIASDRVLIFATGGLSAAGISVSMAAPARPLSAGNVRGSDDETAFGWTAGGGLEIGVTERMSVKAEALYLDLEGQSVTATDPAFPAASASVSTEDLTGVIVRVGANLRF